MQPSFSMGAARPGAPNNVSQKAIVKSMSLDAVARAPELYNLFISSVETDTAFEDMLALIAIAPAILSDTARVTRYDIGPEQVTSSMIPSSGASVLLPNYDAIWEIIRQAIYHQ